MSSITLASLLGEGNFGWRSFCAHQNDRNASSKEASRFSRLERNYYCLDLNA